MPKIIHAYWNQGTFRKIMNLHKGEAMAIRYRYKEGYPITKMVLRCEKKELDLR